MGIPKKKGDEKAKSGATFDLGHFKGNAMFFQHLNELQLSVLRHKIEASEAISKKKKIKTGMGEDYGISLPEDEIQKHEGDSSGSSLLSDEEEKEREGMMKLNRI